MKEFALVMGIFLFFGSKSPQDINPAFKANKTKGKAPLSVSFKANSQSPLNYNWNFGNGTTSSAKEPNVVFQKPGTYMVKLVVSNVYGSDSSMLDIEVLP